MPVKNSTNVILATIFVVLLLFSGGCKATLYKVSDDIVNRVNKLPFSPKNDVHQIPVIQPSKESYPLLKAFPSLQKKLQFVPLCDCPTPIRRLANIEQAISGRSKKIGVYVKQDGQTSSTIYGGNKVRKLELLLAQAIFSKKNRILISGSAGSNSVVATALFAKELGITPDIHLAPQTPSARVRTNLLILARVIQMPMPTNTSKGSISYHKSNSSVFFTILRKILFSPFFMGKERPRKESFFLSGL